MNEQRYKLREQKCHVENTNIFAFDRVRLFQKALKGLNALTFFFNVRPS